MRALEELAAIGPQQIWDGVVARAIHGERLTMAVVELEPGRIVPQHQHENEQLGIVLSGSVTFRIGTEVRLLGPGGTWRIPSDTPHDVRVGPEGAVLIDVFAPIRSDWNRFPQE